MEYAVQVWSPYQKGHITSLESVQRFAFKVCSKQWNADYLALLRKYKIHTLEEITGSRVVAQKKECKGAFVQTFGSCN